MAKQVKQPHKLRAVANGQVALFSGLLRSSNARHVLSQVHRPAPELNQDLASKLIEYLSMVVSYVFMFNFASRRSRSQSFPNQHSSSDNTHRSQKLLTLLAFDLNVRPLLSTKHSEHFLHSRS